MSLISRLKEQIKTQNKISVCEKYEKLRAKEKELASLFDSSHPPTKENVIEVTKFEEAIMWTITSGD